MTKLRGFLHHSYNRLRKREAISQSCSIIHFLLLTLCWPGVSICIKLACTEALARCQCQQRAQLSALALQTELRMHRLLGSGRTVSVRGVYAWVPGQPPAQLDGLTLLWICPCVPTGWARQHCSILHLLPVFKVTSSIVRSTDSPGAEALPPALPLEPGHTDTGSSPCHGWQTETHPEESLTQHAALQQLFFPTS